MMVELHVVLRVLRPRYELTLLSSEYGEELLNMFKVYIYFFFNNFVSIGFILVPAVWMLFRLRAS